MGDYCDEFTWPVLGNVSGVSRGDAVVGELPVLAALEDVVAAVARAEHRVDAAVAAQVRVVAIWKRWEYISSKCAPV